MRCPYTGLEMVSQEPKTCPRCQKLKAPSAFYPSGGKCKDCCHAYYLENRERILKRSTEWVRDNPERVKELKAASRKRNRSKENARKNKRHRELNEAMGGAFWRERKAKRKAAKARRFPSWANRKAIRAIYESCPPGHHVDHIIPLQGENVSGLHVAANLQYLPAEENLAKSNSF